MSEGEEPQADEQSHVSEVMLAKVTGHLYIGKRKYGKGNKIQMGNRTEYHGVTSTDQNAVAHQQHLYNMREEGGENNEFHDGDTFQRIGAQTEKPLSVQEATWEIRGKNTVTVSGSVAEGRKEKERPPNR